MQGMMTDDLYIAIYNKKAKAIVHTECDDAEEVKVTVLCSKCGAAIGASDECPVCGTEVDWGF